MNYKQIFNANKLRTHKSIMKLIINTNIPLEKEFSFRMFFISFLLLLLMFTILTDFACANTIDSMFATHNLQFIFVLSCEYWWYVNREQELNEWRGTKIDFLLVIRISVYSCFEWKSLNKIIFACNASFVCCLISVSFVDVRHSHQKNRKNRFQFLFFDWFDAIAQFLQKKLFSRKHIVCTQSRDCRTNINW